MVEGRPGVGSRPECTVYSISERKDKLSLATLAFLLKRHPVRDGGQGREGAELQPLKASTRPGLHPNFLQVL